MPIDAHKNAIIFTMYSIMEKSFRKHSCEWTPAYSK